MSHIFWPMSRPEHLPKCLRKMWNVGFRRSVQNSSCLWLINNEQTCLELSCSFLIFQSFILIVEQFWFSHLLLVLLYLLFKNSSWISRNALWLIWGLKTQNRKITKDETFHCWNFNAIKIKVLHHYFLIWSDAVNPSTDPSEGWKTTIVETSLVDSTWREVWAFGKEFPKTRN